MKYNLLTIWNDNVLIGYSIARCDYDFTIRDNDGYIIHNQTYSTYDEYAFYGTLYKSSKAKEFINI